MKGNLTFLAFLAVWGLTVRAQETLSLNGIWDYSTGDSTAYNGYVMLPGQLSAEETMAGTGGNVVWYRRSVYVPQSWSKKRVTLSLDSPYSGAAVFVNGQPAGEKPQSAVAHTFDIGSLLTPGKRNGIAIRAGRHAILDATLRAQPSELYIKSVRLTPMPAHAILHLELELDGRRLQQALYYSDLIMEVIVQKDGEQRAGNYSVHHYAADKRRLSLNVPMGEQFLPWDEFRPNVYRIGISLGDDYYETTFGMREFFVDGQQVYLNGYPIWLRGMAVDGDTMLLADETEWNSLLTQYRQDGLNFVRLTSGYPTEAAFAAANRVGVYLQPPYSFGAVAAAYGHHPSFLPADSLLLPVVSGKTEIEANLSNTLRAGFLLRPPADVNVSEGWRNACSPLVALARLADKTYTTADTLTVPVEAMNAMYGDVDNARVTYYISDSNLEVLAGGALAQKRLPLGKNIPLGTIVYPLAAVKAPARLRLAVMLNGKLWNQWEVRVEDEK